MIEFTISSQWTLLAFLIGLSATILTRYSSIPQIIKGVKTRKMDDVSFWLIFYLTVGLFLYGIYGVIIDDLIIIWGNAVGVITNLVLIGLKIKYSTKRFG